MFPAALHTISPWAPDWVVAVGVLVIVVAAGLAIQGLVLRLLDRRKDGWHPLLRALFWQTRGLVRFALVILAVAIAVPVIPMGRQTAAILNEAMVAALVLLAYAPALGGGFATYLYLPPNAVLHRVHTAPPLEQLASELLLGNGVQGPSSPGPRQGLGAPGNRSRDPTSTHLGQMDHAGGHA